eukprot:CAMPEP_0194481504 /NCGR_PEP_ID=MMETSP0253-20130528/3898_1 /TAXON_ID=2966 /ORGANISM="Noctiluca scintillans" /LENGTH=99 /DNA_ID=CAMNT_0039320993 /DNA_START=559 /DNA_END=858 /DNA_ORIENTATION=-
MGTTSVRLAVTIVQHTDVSGLPNGGQPLQAGPSTSYSATEMVQVAAESMPVDEIVGVIVSSAQRLAIAAAASASRRVPSRRGNREGGNLPLHYVLTFGP